MQLSKIFVYICKMKSKEIDIDFDNSIGPWLGKTVKVMDYFLQEIINSEKLDLTKEQIIVLKKLYFKDGLNQNELAFLTLRNKSSLTRLLVKMEKKKYIIRKQSKEDKRINHVFITPTGREMFIKTRPVIKKVMTSMEKNISEEEQQIMISILKKIQTNLGSTVESI